MSEQLDKNQEGEESRHGGPERVRQAALEAAVRLFAEQGIHGVSVREIARDVGVSHTLLHLYFGSKEEIIRQLFRGQESDLAAHIADGGSPTEGALAAVRSIMADPNPARVLAASLLEGIVPEKIDIEPTGQLALVKRLEEMGRDGVSARVSGAVLGSMLIGWAVGGQWLSQSLGMDTLDRDALVGEMEKVVRRVLED